MSCWYSASTDLLLLAIGPAGDAFNLFHDSLRGTLSSCGCFEQECEALWTHATTGTFLLGHMGFKFDKRSCS